MNWIRSRVGGAKKKKRRIKQNKTKENSQNKKFGNFAQIYSKLWLSSVFSFSPLSSRFTPFFIYTHVVIQYEHKCLLYITIIATQWQYSGVSNSTQWKHVTVTGTKQVIWCRVNTWYVVGDAASDSEGVIMVTEWTLVLLTETFFLMWSTKKNKNTVTKVLLGFSEPGDLNTTN